MPKRCEHCGKVLKRKDYEYDREWRRRRFCDKSCAGKAGQPALPKNGRKRCAVCEEEFEQRPNERPGHFRKRKTCGNRTCVGYFGGVAAAQKILDSRRVPTAARALTKKQRKAIVERAGECLLCGKTDELQVHHRDGDRANDGDANLVVLCRDCHAVVEWFIRPVVARYLAS